MIEADLIRTERLTWEKRENADKFPRAPALPAGDGKTPLDRADAAWVRAHNALMAWREAHPQRRRRA